MFRRAYLFFKYRLKKINRFRRNFFNAYYPNKWAVLKGRVNWGKEVKFQQKIFFTGRGFVQIGDKCSFGYKPGGFHYKGSIEIQSRGKDAQINIGRGVSTNNNIFICSCGSIDIGDFTLIGQNVTIMDFEAHGIEPHNRRQLGEVGQVRIGENVWIGNNVIILKNTSIGKNSIVAAGAVVSGDFPGNVIIGGVPARVIKQIDQ